MNTKSTRNSSMTIPYKKELMYMKNGSLKELEGIIQQNNIDIGPQEIMETLPMYIQNLSERQRQVFRLYYWTQMSIERIRYQANFHSMKDAKDTLDSATKKYIKYLSEDYGIKNAE